MIKQTKENLIDITLIIAVVIVGVTAIICLTVSYITVFNKKEPTPLQQPTAQVSMNPYLFETIESKIVRLAKESDVLPETALRIARCESNLDPLAENDKSSASGIYQFLDGTFESYCEGDVYNPEDNIKCFLKYYPEHSGWWICK